MEGNFPYSLFFSPQSNQSPSQFNGTKHGSLPFDLVLFVETLKTVIPNYQSIPNFEQCFKSIGDQPGKILLEISSGQLVHFENIIKQTIQDLFKVSLDTVQLIWKEELTKSDVGQGAIKRRIQGPKEHVFTLGLSPTREDLENKIESKFISHIEGKADARLFLDPNKSFETFIVGPSNNMAYATALAVGKNPGRAYPCLYFYSKSGLGKTHLLHAIGNMIRDNHPHLKICITTAREFMNEVIEATKNRLLNDFPQKYSEGTDVLMVDDVHELNNKEATQNIFFHVFNELHKKGKQLIFTSDKEPREIEGLEERIKTRLSWGLVLDIQPPDLETRIAILKQKAIKEDIIIPDDVITLVASSIKNNIRELEGSLIKLAAYSSVFQVAIDAKIAREQLRLDDYTAPKVINLDSVARAVSQYFKLPLADLKSKSRSKELALARHISMYVSYKVVHSTYSEIGGFYGGRDHSTVMHAVEKIKEQMKIEHRIAINISEIEDTL